MKQLLVLSVALLMLVKPLWPVAEYIVNYDYIVNVLCENKDKPELKCDGKCYLAKQLAKETKQNDKNPFNKNQSENEIQHLVYFQSLFRFNLNLDDYDSAPNNFNSYKTLISRLFTSDISRPPELG